MIDYQYNGFNEDLDKALASEGYRKDYKLSKVLLSLAFVLGFALLFAMVWLSYNVYAGLPFGVLSLVSLIVLLIQAFKKY